MGKKTNIKQILQVGKKNNNYIWDSKYIEQHINESQIYLFQSLEIKKFITNFLKIHGLNLYKYNIDFSEAKLKIFISYFKTSEIKNIISKINVNQKLRLIRKKKLKSYVYNNNLRYLKIKQKFFEINKNSKNKIFNLFYNFYNTYFFLKKNIESLKKRVYQYNLKKTIEQKKFLIKLKYFLLKKNIYHKFNFSKLKLNLKFFYNKYLIKKIMLNYIYSMKLKKLLAIKYQKYFNFFLVKYNNYKNLVKTFLVNKKLYKKRLQILSHYKEHLKIKHNKTTKELKVNNFLRQLTESLNIFTKNNFNYTIILQQINQNIIFNLTYRQLQSLKKVLVQLRQFKNSSFFKEGINVILSTLIDSNNINLLSDFIATQLKMTKRHGFFFKFLTKTLSLAIKQKFSKTKSIKILIKGRINGKPRSKQKLILINKYMPLMTINSSICSTQSTSFSPNGTFGIKLWLNKN